MKREPKATTGAAELSEFAYPAQLERASRLPKSKSKHKWLVDSGASSHISPYECEVVHWRTRTRSTFKTASGKRAVCIGRGDIVVRMKDESGKKVRIVLQNVAIIPESPMRLIAVSKLPQTTAPLPQIPLIKPLLLSIQIIHILPALLVELKTIDS